MIYLPAQINSFIFADGFESVIAVDGVPLHGAFSTLCLFAHTPSFTSVYFSCPWVNDLSPVMNSELLGSN